MRLALPLALLVLAGCAREAAPLAPAAADSLEVSGTLLYHERVMLPPGATASVALVALDRPGDAPLAETTFTPEGQPPIPFALRAPAALDTTRAYGLRARLEAEGGTMRWTTLEPVPILTRGHGRTAEVVLRQPAEREGEHVWIRARERGVTFRAVGQEPGWLLDVYDTGDAPARLDLQTNYGEETYAFAAAERSDDEDGRAVYRAASGATSVEVTIEDGLCHDTMSGEEFEAAVTVRVNGATYTGCGRALN